VIGMVEGIHVEEIGEQAAAAVRTRCAPEDIGDFVGAAFGEVMGALGAQGLEPTGPPFSRYVMGEGGMDALGQATEFDITAGFPCTSPVAPTGRVEPVTLPGGEAVVAMHVGPYTELGEAYAAVAAWMDEHGLEVRADPWEAYLDGPEVAAPRTQLTFPSRPRG
jgi:effector-binding domain-containing protein